MKFKKLIYIAILFGFIFSCKSWKDEVPKEWCRCWYGGLQCHVGDVYYTKDSILLNWHVSIKDYEYVEFNNTVVPRDSVILQVKCTQ